MLEWFRNAPWQRWGLWLRVLGIIVLLVVFFVPLSSALLVGLAVPGLVLFLLGALPWLFRTEEPWLRRGS